MTLLCLLICLVMFVNLLVKMHLTTTNHTNKCKYVCSQVLQIFARARFGPGRAGHYGNANLAPPPVTLSIDQGNYYFFVIQTIQES